MEFRLRLMPLALAAAVGLLGLKLGDVWFALSEPVSMARAEQSADKSAKPDTAKPAAKPDTAKPAAKPAAMAEAAKAETPAAAGKDQGIDPLSISPSEIELLQKLSERRNELDKRAAELSQREVLLQATEKRIDDKIAKLAALEKQIGGLVDKQSEEDEARTKSLVKIYETMKPTDAARIFEQLDMPVLLGVLEHMKERNAAPVLAAMDPAKAKAVTLALAARKDQRAKMEVSADTPSGKAAKP